MFGLNRLNWVKHLKSLHKKEFNELVENIRSGRDALNQAVDNVGENDDDEQEVRFSYYLVLEYIGIFFFRKFFVKEKTRTEVNK